MVVPFLNSTGLAIVAEADLRCGDFLSKKVCRYKLVVFTSFWSWVLKVSSVLTTKKIHSDNFFVLFMCYWVVGLLAVQGCTKFLILVFMFQEYVFFCVCS